MVGQSALAAEGSIAIRAGKLLRARIRPDHRRRRRRRIRRRGRKMIGRRMIGRLEDVAPRDIECMVIHLNSA